MAVSSKINIIVRCELFYFRPGIWSLLFGYLSCMLTLIVFVSESMFRWGLTRISGHITAKDNLFSRRQIVCISTQWIVLIKWRNRTIDSICSPQSAFKHLMAQSIHLSKCFNIVVTKKVIFWCHEAEKKGRDPR